MSLLFNIPFPGSITNEGTQFAIALSKAHTSSSAHKYDGEIIINARKTTNINITTRNGDDTFMLAAGNSVHYQVDRGFRVSYGTIENKGSVFLLQDYVSFYILYRLTTFIYYVALLEGDPFSNPLTHISDQSKVAYSKFLCLLIRIVPHIIPRREWGTTICLCPEGGEFVLNS